ncbi:MAG: rhomboid family intramembrane serine protease [Sphingorhabdus sp.]
MIDRLKVIAAVCGLMIAVYIADLLSGGYLKSFGIHPREIGSIYTIFTSPWLHGDIFHLANNLFGLAIFGALCLMKGVRYFFSASVLIILLTGILVWLFARDANHIGASGWIFGLWSLTIALAWFERSFQSIAIGIAVIFFYSGMAFGVLPTNSAISFEGHLFGALSGILVAALLEKNEKFARWAGS